MLRKCNTEIRQRKSHLEEGPGCNGQRKGIKTKEVDIPEVEREKYFKKMRSVN